jgi:hypothetical protein
MIKSPLLEPGQNVRPGSYILALQVIKSNLETQINHCQLTLALLQAIVNDPNYDSAATELEKSNIATLTSLINSGLETLTSIVWE